MAEFKFSDLLPGHFQNSEEIKAYVDTFQDVYEDDLRTLSKDLVSLKNPHEFPIEIEDFERALEDFVDFQLPDFLHDTKEEKRDQLANVVDWIKLKGLELGVRSFLTSIGFDGSTEVMASNDYKTFLTDSDVFEKFGQFPPGWFYTNHVEVRMFPTQNSIKNNIWWDEQINNVISDRLNQLYPATAVPHRKFVLKLFAQERHQKVSINGTNGVTIEDYYFPIKPVEVGKCHDVDDKLVVTRQYDYMDAENVDHAKIGTFSGTMDKNTSSLDQVFDTINDLTIDKEREKELVRVVGTVDDSIEGKTYNSAGLYDKKDNLMAIGTFPDVTHQTDSFLSTELEFTILESGWDDIDAQGSEGTDVYLDQSAGDVESFYTDEVWFDWHQDPRLSRPYQLDKGLKLDNEDGESSFISVLSDPGSYWKAGDLKNHDPSSDPTDPAIKEDDVTGELSLWNPKIGSCKDFRIRHFDGMASLEIITRLNKSPLFGEGIEQVGFFDERDHLLLVVEFDEITIEDQFDRARVHFQLDVV